ncbi:hypothetical protein LSCM4_04794 [Leishmania orientalis]|uniref:Palmitoyltransferase n=1 Tax=Leishmania orientalis TaxID=2249476 RepID=A0A836GNU3_9TRYP|nr:hypothetical protein LSCM4_04794 [Leishmania orientalis]
MSDNRQQQQQRHYKDGSDDAIIVECRCLNLVAHPDPPKGCHEGCMMCCGYCTPAVIALLIASLAIASDVYSLLLIVRNSRDAWRIAVCIFVFILTTSMCALVLWSFHAIVFSSPGFVPQDPWAYPPLYAGPSINSCDGATHVCVQSSQPSSARQPLLPQQPQQQHEGAALPPQASSPSSLAKQSPIALGPSRTHTASYALASASAEGASCPNPLYLRHEAPSPGGASVGETGNGAYAAPINVGNNGALDVGNCRDASDTRVAEASDSSRHSPYPPPSPHEQRVGRTYESAVSFVLSVEQEQHNPIQPTWPNPYTVTALDRGGKLRFCDVCHVYKPDGAHHCRTCRRCVYNFDHHCPFLNNCVGRNNYKLFIIFLLYSGVAAVLAACLMLVTIFVVDRDDIMIKAAWAIVPGLDIVLGFSLLMFYVQHRVLLCKGQSTLENLAAGGNGGFEDCLRSCKRPRLAPEQKAENARRRKEKTERHRRTLLGKESSLLRMYLPLPVRTDNTADETVPASI